MNHKTFNIIILLTLTVLLLFTLGLNIIIDPFYILKTPQISKLNEQKPLLKKQERITRILQLKFSPKNIDTVILGSSTVDCGISSDYYTELTSNNAINVAFFGPDIVDLTIFADKVIKLHPEIKKIIIGLDFFGFKEDKRELAKFNNNNFITMHELAQILVSYGAIESSIETIKYNLNNSEKPAFTRDGASIIRRDEKIQDKFHLILNSYINGDGYYKNYKLSSRKIEALKDLKTKCANNNIELIIFINPVHAAQLQSIKTANSWEQFKYWKKLLLEISNYYDFSHFNKLYEEPISPDMNNFLDSIHYSTNIGNKIIAKISGEQSDIGYYVTKDNIGFLNKKIDKDYQIWKSKNQELVSYIESLKR